MILQTKIKEWEKHLHLFYTVLHSPGIAQLADVDVPFFYIATILSALHCEEEKNW